MSILSNPLVQKILTGIVGAAVGWVNDKYKLGLNSQAIAASTVAIIVGIAFHNGMKDHGVNADGGAK